MTGRIFIVLVLGVVLNSFSQIKFEKGYFIDNAGIKTECFIKNKDSQDNPKEFEYKTTLDSDSEIKTIQTVKEFAVLGESLYKRFEVSIDLSKDNINKLRTDKEPKYEKRTLFLKVLTQGDAVLYEYTENNITRFLYSIQDSAIKQLVYKRYLQGSKIATNNHFRQQLWSDLRCEAISMNQVEKIDYYKKELKRYFIKYNSCKNPDFKLEKREKTPGVGFKLSIRPGINFSQVTLDDNVTANTTEVIDYGSKTLARVGLKLEYVFPFNRNKWALFVEPTYRYYVVKDKEVSYIPTSVVFDKAIVSIDYKSIELPIGIQHSFFLNDRSKIFINGALVVDFAFNSKINLDIENLVSVLDLDITSGTSLAFGIGYSFKDKYSIELRHLTNRNLLDNGIPAVKAEYKGTPSIIFGYTIF